jgi:prepilin-type N-terminal cleavage/methylation domain-containing protein
MKATRTKESGFSLTELSIVLVIIGLLISGMISGFATFRKNSLIQQAQRDLEIIHDALVGYATSNGRLPCPDRIDSGDGQQDWDNTNCDTNFGFLPYRDLGLSGVVTDPWGIQYAYRVEGEFADNVPGTSDSAACPDADFPAAAGVSFEICAQGGILVHDMGGVAPGDCGGSVPTCNVIAENIPAIFYSFGADGFDTQSVHELENMIDNASNDPGIVINDPNEEVFVWRQYSDTLGATDTRFDDQVMWISTYVLINRLIQAQRLP